MMLSYSNDDMLSNDAMISNIPITDHSADQSRELQNHANISYAAIIATATDLIQILKKKHLKGIHIADNRLENITIMEADADGNVTNGTIRFRLTATNYAEQTTQPIFVTFAIEADSLHFDESFRDNLNRTYPLTADKVRELLING